MEIVGHPHQIIPFEKLKQFPKSHYKTNYSNKIFLIISLRKIIKLILKKKFN